MSAVGRARTAVRPEFSLKKGSVTLRLAPTRSLTARYCEETFPVSKGDDKLALRGMPCATDSNMDAPQHVVVGYDGSTLSELALNRALRLTENAPFGMIHVVCVVEEHGDQVRLPTGETLSRWAALEALRHSLHALTKSWGRNPNVRLVAHLRSGETGQAIIDLAYRYHADQLVLGATSHDGDNQLRIGSTARMVMENCSIPVHIETALMASGPSKQFSPMRWAYVFGGPALRRHHLNTQLPGRRPNA